MAAPGDDLERLADRITDIRRFLVVLDFDGTLSPIVERPDAARLAEGAAEALAAIAGLTDVAIVSGRHVDDLEPRLDGLPVVLVGGHGTEVRRPDGSRTSLFDPQAAGPLLDDLADELREVIGDRPGWELERKPASIAVHHRRVAPDDAERRLARIRDAMAARAGEGDGWALLDGKAVTELRPRGVDKGTALRWLEPQFPGKRLLVVGDDVTDEDAFEAARELDGVTVLVADQVRATAATHRLDDPGRVVELLHRLASAAADARARDGSDHRFHPIRDYGLIGDSRTAALVGPDGSIDWLCLPRFDSPSVFGAILDPDRGGRWRIRPLADVEVQRTYIGETNVLVTRFTRDGDPILTLTDLLVYSRVNAFDPTHTGHILIRRVQAHDDVEVELEFQPRFDYGRATTRMERVEDGIRASAGAEYVRLVAPGTTLEVHAGEDGLGDVASARFRLHEDDERWFRMPTRGSERGPHRHLSEPELLDLTVRTWGRWAQLIDYDGPYRDEVVRSALVLKCLVYEPTGALVAAPTTSLPEGIGGTRNWDYRYAWIRDSAYVLECFLRIGHRREAETFIRWLSELSDRIGGAHALQPLYRVTGEEELFEFTLEHLHGYRGSRPVRVGNGAATQLQLDIYGAAMELGYLTEQVGAGVPSARWSVIMELVESVIERWEEPDSGLWEVRSRPRHHTFSKFQCWLAVDRAIRIGRDLGLRAPYARWEMVAEMIRDSIMRRGFDEERGTFVQAYGSPALDASLLLLPLKGFIPATDPRVASTVAAIREDLEVGDGLLLRYRTDDGLPGSEGAFLLCSFWLVELLARMGELEEASRLLGRLRRLAGPLALFAEEVDPATEEHLGNFPQGFTHMGLIAAATALDQELRTRRRTLSDILRED